jgi:hypothetical protein
MTMKYLALASGTVYLTVKGYGGRRRIVDIML